LCISNIFYKIWKGLLVYSTIKHRITIWSSNSTSEYTCKRTESRQLNRYLHTHVHSSIQAFLQTTHGSSNGWTEKQNVIHTFIQWYYLPSKRRRFWHWEGDSDTIIYLNLEDIKLKENKLGTKEQILWLYLSEINTVINFVAARAGGEKVGNGKLVLMGTVCLEKWRHCGDGCTMCMYLTPLNYTLTNG
jgi:hypothetical protein